MAISNITLAKPGLNTTKIEGFSVTASNITSSSIVTKHELSDIYWITSEMKLKSTGGNSKLVAYCDTTNTKIGNPNVSNGTTNVDAVGSDPITQVITINSKDTFPATKRYVADAELCRVIINNAEGRGTIIIGDENNGNPVNIQITNDSPVLPITVLDVAYHTNKIGSVTAAALCRKDADYILYIGTSGSETIDYTDVIASKLYCDKAKIVLILEKVGSVAITKYPYGSNESMYHPVTISKAGYTYLKVMNPFLETPTYAGYKTDGIYVNGTRVVEETGILGMAVNLVVNNNYTTSWVYKQANGVCRDQAEHSVATITGNMNLGYLYQTHIISDAVELTTDPIDDSTDINNTL